MISVLIIENNLLFTQVTFANRELMTPNEET